MTRSRRREVYSIGDAHAFARVPVTEERHGSRCARVLNFARHGAKLGRECRNHWCGRVAQLVRALVSHTRGPGFESLRDHCPPYPDGGSKGARISSVATFPRGLVSLRVWTLPAAIALLASVSRLEAQIPSQLPSPAQAQQLLQNPDLVAQLRQRLLSSGLTPDQIRARLRAAGYPENFLDAYLPGGTGGDSLSGSTLDAVSQLGLIDSAGYDSLQGTGAIDSINLQRFRAARDTEPAEEPMDTLLLLDDSAAVAAARERARRRAALVGSEPNPLLAPYPAIGGAGAAGLSRAGGGSLQRIDTTGLLARQPTLQGRLPPDTGLSIFGLNLFERRTTLFQPNVSGPVDASYRLGPGDQLVLILTGEVELARSLTVTREGFVVIPQVGQLYVANLTLGQLEDLLYERLGRVYSGVRRGPDAKTHFSVSISRLRNNQVFVVGDVTAPGSYQISSVGTMLTALYAAAGPTPNGSMRSILLRRGGKKVDSLDVYDYLLRGDASHDARLESGDVVFVSVHGPRIKITGEILRPAIYELKPGETLRDLIRSAGGFTATATRRRVQITRVLPPQDRPDAGRNRIVIDVASTDLVSGDGPPLPLEGGDSVAVFRVDTRLRNRIAVRGDVWLPGAQGFTAGEHLSDAIKLAGGLRPDAYLGAVLVTRLVSDSVHSQLRTAFRDSTGALVDDIPLREDDAIQIFALREFRARRYVAIAGAVRKGGRYSYREGMTLRDLVLLAGGPQESADLREAEIARLPENRAGGVTAITVRVPLDSTYLVAKGPDETYVGPPGVAAPQANAPEVTLHPYDNVLILRQPNWQLQRTVVVTGEVLSPGRYTLTAKSERLTSVLTRAGGLTDEAYADGVALYRSQDRTGRIGVDLPRVLHNRHDRDDLILQDGDSIDIPSYTGVVRVSGEVNAPTAVSYVPGENINYYIRAAGGPTYKADPGHAYVRQPEWQDRECEPSPVFRQCARAPSRKLRVCAPERPDAASARRIGARRHRRGRHSQSGNGDPRHTALTGRSATPLDRRPVGR